MRVNNFAIVAAASVQQNIDNVFVLENGPVPRSERTVSKEERD